MPVKKDARFCGDAIRGSAAMRVMAGVVHLWIQRERSLGDLPKHSPAGC